MTAKRAAPDDLVAAVDVARRRAARLKRQVDSTPETPVTITADAASSPAPPRYSADELARMSAVDYFLATGSMDRVDEVIGEFIRDENAKVDRAYRALASPRCRRCDHLVRHHHPIGRPREPWAGACSFALCSCPGPEPAG